jgi:DNA gyrase/topoisomerase IV subunit B
VRKRPGMYIGSTGQRGLHHLLYEVLDNAVDEVQAGHARNVDVEIDTAGGYVTISDDGEQQQRQQQQQQQACWARAVAQPAFRSQPAMLASIAPVPSSACSYSHPPDIHHTSYQLHPPTHPPSQHHPAHQPLHPAPPSISPCPLMQPPPLPPPLAGRGIPTSIHPQTGKSALETVLTVLHAGGKFGGDSSGYSVSGGLHGVGISVVNALSSDLEIDVWRGGKHFRQQYSRGHALGPLVEQALPAEQQQKRGTRVRFRYDDQIFAEGVAFDPDTIKARIRELAFLNSAATLRFRAVAGAGSNGSSSDAAGGGWQVFHYDGGLREYVEWLNSSRSELHEAIYVNKTKDKVQVGALGAGDAD